MFAASYLSYNIFSIQATLHHYTPVSTLKTMAAETPNIALAGQAAKKTASQAKKRKAAEIETAADAPLTTPDAAEMASDASGTHAAKKVASRGRKRKAAVDDSAAEAPSKKMKKETNKPGAKPRQTKRTKKVADEPPPPPIPSPVEVTVPVQMKIDAVKKFISTEMAREISMLERDPNNPNLVSIPELDLLGIIMTLYFHFQLGSAETAASISDVEDAITERFKAPLLTAGDVDWVTLNIATPTSLDKRIKEKTQHHGLDEVSLLEVEMELSARRNRAAMGMYEWEAEKAMKTGELLSQIIEVGWDEMRRRIDVARMKGSEVDGREEGRKGVCPKPAEVGV